MIIMLYALFIPHTLRKGRPGGCPNGAHKYDLSKEKTL